MTIEVRSATTADTEWIAETLRRIASEAPDGAFVVPEEDVLRGLITALPHGRILIADDSDGNMGLLILSFSRSLLNPLAPVATVMCWWVDPGERGRGAGAALMLAAEREVKRNGLDNLSIFIADGPDSGVTIAKRFGFSPLERVYHKKVR